mmetsp:Transcript_13658/g.18922  ORF Transcript_13658/g.18922 Transcript_13658/m.18922 type:complete len:84 (-) Transcript_13658:301-552(-)
MSFVASFDLLTPSSTPRDHLLRCPIPYSFFPDFESEFFLRGVRTFLLNENFRLRGDLCTLQSYRENKIIYIKNQMQFVRKGNL